MFRELVAVLHLDHIACELRFPCAAEVLLILLPCLATVIGIPRAACRWCGKRLGGFHVVRFLMRAVGALALPDRRSAKFEFKRAGANLEAHHMEYVGYRLANLKSRAFLCGHDGDNERHTAHFRRSAGTDDHCAV